MARFKYPRTKHLPWSPGVHSDDLVNNSLDSFKDKNIVVTEKMDGENTTLYSDYIHARSINNNPHPSRSWVKSFHGSIASLIPEGWRLCGENVYAKHSVEYLELPSFFLLFSVWNEKNECLSWVDTIEWAQLIGVEVVPVLYEGVFDEGLLRNIVVDTTCSEGYVVRNSGAFAFEDFSLNVAKWVRTNHVQSDEHWMHKEVVPNVMKDK
jgi:hypothetical protein